MAAVADRRNMPAWVSYALVAAVAILVYVVLIHN